MISFYKESWVYINLMIQDYELDAIDLRIYHYRIRISGFSDFEARDS